MKTKSDCDCRDCGEENKGRILNLLVFALGTVVTVGAFYLFRFWK